MEPSFVKLVITCAVLCLFLDGQVDARPEDNDWSWSSSWSKGGSRNTMSGKYRSFSKNWKLAALKEGRLYASSNYLSHHINEDDVDPVICYNEVDKRPWPADYTRGYGLFVCPLDGRDSSKIYCCGAQNRERCCGFWDDSGRLAAVVLCFIALCIILAGIVCVVICCCCRRTAQVCCATRCPCCCSVCFGREAQPPTQSTKFSEPRSNGEYMMSQVMKSEKQELPPAGEIPNIDHSPPPSYTEGGDHPEDEVLEEAEHPLSPPSPPARPHVTFLPTVESDGQADRHSKFI